MPIDFSRVRVLIVDMDNTLCDTFHTLSKPQWQRVERKLLARGLKKESAFLKRNFGKHSFRHSLERSGLAPADIALSIKEYDKVDVKGLKLFPDAGAITGLRFPKILLSRGEPSLQRRKIRHLGLRRHFDEVRIVPTFQYKLEVLKDILAKRGLEPKEALVIGDRIEEEIADARTLGIPSVLVRRPDWPVARSSTKPDLTVRDLRVIASRFAGKRLKKRA